MPNGCCQRFPSKGCFDRKLRGFEEDTMTKFVVWTKDKTFGVDEPKPVSKKMKWKLLYVPFDGIPFMVVGRRVYSCHQGVDKHKHEKLTRQLQLLDDHSDHCYEERQRLQDSKKSDSLITRYLMTFINRKESTGCLRRALTKNPSAVKLEEQYVACFPGIEEHKNHPVVGAVREPVETSSTPPSHSIIPHKDISNPPRNSVYFKTKKSKRCESLLRQISNLTYHLQDEPFLDSLTFRLNDLLEDVRRHTPHDDTLPLSYTPPSQKKIDTSKPSA
ncbi:LOW QUALITY PROTEIN: uncharacterized protein LOC107667537 [Sinocyclocheilus anshuiensis]|uniref:LOW QUALITY PROTEIN: uncharacterized protein LOC107667537 n=1 Tax=Sinocyclocheilus anshuiensis TaxID=1608454 RepID=UPI003D687967